MPRPGLEPTVLLASASSALIDSLMRLAAAAGVEAQVAHDVMSAQRRWGQAALVLVGADLAGELSLAPVRRDGVVLVGSADQRAALYERAVTLGAEHVALLPEAEGRLVELMTLVGEPRGSGAVVSVVGCRGGTGASTLTAALGLQAVRDGLSCVVVDADPDGADLDALLDMVDEPGLRWADLAASHGRLPAEPLAASLPRRDGVALLCTDSRLVHDGTRLPPEAVSSVLDAARRAFDLVLVDLPRWLPVATRVALEVSDATVLVTTADVRGSKAAGRVAAAVAGPTRPTLLVVRTSRSASVDPLDIAEALTLPLAGTMHHDRRMAADADRGDLVVRAGLRRTARQVLLGLSGAEPAFA